MENKNEIHLVYHYTTLKNFKSIIKSNRLQCSLLRKSNDKSECFAEYNNNNEMRKIQYVCTSSSAGNAAMWYHYGEKYSGVCIGLAIPSDGFLLRRINYSPRYQHPCEIGNREEAIDFLSSKSSCWNYEDEVRVFLDQERLNAENDGGISNIASLIERVILGYDFDYNKVDLETAIYLHTLYQNNRLYTILLSKGTKGKELLNNSPRLIEMFQRYKLGDFN